MNVFEDADNLEREQEEEYVTLSFASLQATRRRGPGIRMTAQPLGAPGRLPAIDLHGRDPLRLLEWLSQRPARVHLRLPEVSLQSLPGVQDVRIEYNNGQVVWVQNRGSGWNLRHIDRPRSGYR